MSFADLSVALDPSLIPNALSALAGSIDNDELTPAQIYQEFETIHPFEGGNGRVGAPLYNMARGKMLELETPPSYRKVS